MQPQLKREYPLHETRDLFIKHGIINRRNITVEAKQKAVAQLVQSCADLFGWKSDQGRANKMVELSWEIGLVLDRRGAIKQVTFLRYARAMHDRGFVPLDQRG